MGEMYLISDGCFTHQATPKVQAIGEQHANNHSDHPHNWKATPWQPSTTFKQLHINYLATIHGTLATYHQPHTKQSLNMKYVSNHTAT